MGEVVQVQDIEWQPVRPEITNDIQGRTLLDGKVKAVLTRVASGGRFRMHKDKYGDLFYFTSGTGKLTLSGKEYDITPGLVVRIAAGESHAYENLGREDLVLISMNLPDSV